MGFWFQEDGPDKDTLRFPDVPLGLGNPLRLLDRSLTAILNLSVAFIRAELS